MNQEENNQKEEILSDIEVREKRRAWEQRYEKSLQDFVSRIDASYEDLITLVWEKGILDHIAPTDPLERKAREQVQADLFDRNDNDPELYWRIMYAAGNTKNTIQKNMTIIGGYTTLSITRALYQLALNAKLQEKIFPEKDDAGNRFALKIADSIIEKAQEEIKKRGSEPHKSLLPIGSKGTVFNIPVMIDSYGGDGLIALRAASYEDHARLGEKIKELTGRYSSSIPPRYLDPDAFHENNKYEK